MHALPQGACKAKQFAGLLEIIDIDIPVFHRNCVYQKSIPLLALELHIQLKCANGLIVHK